MDKIEFLKHTDHRNLKYNIDSLVKQKLREYELELNERRERLRQLLDSENQQYELELFSFRKAYDENKSAKRMEWIELMRLDRERHDAELLEEKKKQREFESSDEYKQMRSREMLLESKQAQLYQIEEKRLLKEEQSKIERFWLETMAKYNEEKGLQEYKEHKLRKCIANVDQQKNLDLNSELKTNNQTEAKALRDFYDQDNIRAVNIDKKYKKDCDFYEWRKRVHHKDVLEVKNRAFQEEYLKYTSEEKKSIREMEGKLDGLLIGTGCVLEQKEKRPYSKNTR